MAPNILVLSLSPRGRARDGAPPIALPRPGGAIEPVPATSTCLRLADAFIAGATAAGAACTLKSLHELGRISPCRACYGCVKTGRCVLRDDMTELYDAFDRADAVLFVSPLYYATLPAQGLAVINRLYPYWIDGIRYPRFVCAGVIGACADEAQSWELFDATWRSIFREIGWPEAGIRHAPRFMEHEAEQLAAARAFGMEFAAHARRAGHSSTTEPT